MTRLNKMACAPTATQFATIIIPKGEACYDATFVNSINYQCIYNFTPNEKTTLKKYTIQITNLSLKDNLGNFCGETPEGYVKIDPLFIKWYASRELANQHTTRKSKLLEWLSTPFFETSKSNNSNTLTGIIKQRESKNLFFTKNKTGLPGQLRTSYRLSKLSILILTFIIIFICIVIYKRKHK